MLSDRDIRRAKKHMSDERVLTLGLIHSCEQAEGGAALSVLKNRLGQTEAAYVYRMDRGGATLRGYPVNPGALRHLRKRKLIKLDPSSVGLYQRVRVTPDGLKLVEVLLADVRAALHGMDE